jgi:hypothetical protein
MPDSPLATALAAFHAELPEVHKGSTNPAFKSKYADLADIVKVVLPALAKHGLAWITRPILTEDGFVLAYELRHTSGDSVSGEWPLPDPTKAKPQELGSAVTYAKRYALSAVTGIAPDEDDDGNRASADSAPRASARRESSKERVNAALAAISTAQDLAALDKVWHRVQDGGLSGVAELVTAHTSMKKALAGTTEPAPVDEWALVEVPS